MKEITTYSRMPFDPRDPASFGSNVPSNYVSRPSECHEIRLRIHHGGEFVGHLPLELKYIKGSVEETNWGWDINEISYIEMTKLVKGIGYASFKSLWYWDPKCDFSEGLKPLNCDKDVLKFSETVEGLDVINVFIEHLVDIPIIRVDIEGNENENGTDKAVEDYEVDISDHNDEDYVGDVVDNMDTSDEEDSDYDGKVDELEDSESNVSLDDSDYDEQWDWTSVLPDETQNPNVNHRPAE
ncbi:hypothetical protein SESBI_51138, partial [Sesbania bispinosa]